MVHYANKDVGDTSRKSEGPDEDPYSLDIWLSHERTGETGVHINTDTPSVSIIDVIPETDAVEP